MEQPAEAGEDEIGSGTALTLGWAFNNYFDEGTKSGERQRLIWADLGLGS